MKEEGIAVTELTLRNDINQNISKKSTFFREQFENIARIEKDLKSNIYFFL